MSSYCSKINLHIILPPSLDLPSNLFHSGFPTKTLHTNTQRTQGQIAVTLHKHESICLAIWTPVRREYSSYGGRVIAQTIRRWLLTVEPRVRPWVITCEIRDEQNDIGAEFYPNLFSFILHACMYVCMYVEGVGHKIQPLHRELQWSIVLPLLINPLLIPHLEWSVGLCIWGVIVVTWFHEELAQVMKYYVRYSLTIAQDKCGWFVFF
jgi:hypothetical protein